MSPFISPASALGRRLCAVLFAWVMVAGVVKAQLGLPVVEYRDLGDVRAKGPVWAFVATAEGELVVGADQLLVVAGGAVQRVDLAGGYAVRALAVAPKAEAGDGRIWYGAVGDLGWLERDPTGSWRTHSLRAQLPPGRGASEGFWHVQATPQGAVFIGEHQVLRWDGKRIEQWEIPAEPRLQPLRFASDTVWFAQRGRGLVRLEACGPVLAVAQAELPAEGVVWLLPPVAGAATHEYSPLDDGTILGASDAVYIRLGGRWVPQGAIARELAGAMPVCATRLASGAVAIGTFLRGVAVVAPNADGGVVLEWWRRADGLPSEQVHTLWTDEAARLWLGFVEGWACIPQPERAGVFDSRNGLGVEPVRGLVRAGGATYVVEARGATRWGGTTAAGERSSMAQKFPLDTVVWDFAMLDEQLFVGGVGGVWRLHQGDKGEAQWVQERFVSSDVFCLEPSRRRAHWLYFTEGSTVKALEATPRGWATRELGVELADTPVSLVEDGAGDLWVSTIVGGIVRYRLIEAEGVRPHLRQVAQFRAGQGLPIGTRRPMLTRIGTEVFVFTENGILRATRERGLEPVAGAEGLVGLVAARGGMGNEGYWFVARTAQREGGAGQVMRVRLQADRSAWFESLDVPQVPAQGRATSLDWIDGTVWLGGQRGMVHVQAPEVLPPPPAVGWVAIALDGLALSVTSGETAVALGADAGTLSFGFAARRVLAPEERCLFQTRLLPVEAEWSEAQPVTLREFTGLGAGRYRFEVRVIAATGLSGPEIGYDFSVAPPWFLRWPALGGVAILLIVATLLFVQARVERLRRQARRLNRMVEERTRELALANDAKSEFLANISHEIRNPLNGVSGLSAMLNEAGLSGRAAELAGSLGACARSLNRVFEDVLAFSKLELGTATPVAKVFELRALVGDVAGVFAAQARERAVPIRVQLPAGGPWWFLGDEARLHTILENFVRNALRHAPGSPVEIAVELGDGDVGAASGVEVTFNVTDHGPGVPAAEQELIFRKFVRGSRARERGEPGAGLGLATCKLLAELLGGSVGIESEPGQPTTFYLSVRLNRHAAPQPKASTEAFVAGESKPGRALIVDDQEFNRLVAQRIAEQLGYSAEIARDGVEALAAYRRMPCELVFLDWELPGAKGGAVARQLRALPGGAQAVIVATTAHDSDAIRLACREAGMDAFALKPYDEAMIARLVREAKAARAAGGEFDRSVFSYLGRGDAAEMARLVTEYVATLDRELTALGAAADSGDVAALAQAAHRLRSHAGLVRYRPLNSAAQALQEEAAQADVVRRAELVVDIREQAAELKIQISRAR